MNLTKLSIFDFNDYAEYLTALSDKYGRSDESSFSLTAWSQRLGYQSPSSLTMILKKQRVPSKKMTHLLCQDLGFSNKEAHYFSLLVQLERAKTKGTELTQTLSQLKAFQQGYRFQHIDLATFSTISYWYCLVIKQLTRLKGFQNNPQSIKKMLRGKVTVAKIRQGIENLKTAGILIEEKGQLKDSGRGLFTGDNIPSISIRNHHKGMIKNSLEALEEQSVKNRMFQALTLCFNKSNSLDGAKKDLSDFVREFNSKYSEDTEGDSVYQLNIQLFEHTDSKET